MSSITIYNTTKSKNKTIYNSLLKDELEEFLTSKKCNFGN